MDASDPTKNLTWYNEEMEDCATGYAAYILEMVEATKESCGLNNLQKILDGEPLGGKASAESDFASDEDDDFLD